MTFSIHLTENNRKSLPFWLLSLGLHGVLALLFTQSLLLQKTAPSEPIPIEWVESGKTRQQIVFSKIRNQSEPKKDAFLGEKNQAVERETVARETGNRAKPTVAAMTPPKPQKVSPQKMNLRAFGVQYFQKTPVEQKPIAQEGSLNESAGDEYLKGFEEGRETMLNTKEFVFFGYFQRVRQSLDRAWSNRLSEEMRHFFNRGRHLAESRDYTTQLLVTLDDQGHVKRIQLVEASGTEDLDSAAVKAFDSAGPFPNPPKGLINTQGFVKIRWDFVVKT